MGHCDLNVVDSDIQASIDIATEYAQIHLAEKLAHHKLTVIDAGIVPLTDEMLELEHHLLAEHTVVQEAVHIYLEHGVNSMYVLVCTEDRYPFSEDIGFARCPEELPQALCSLTSIYDEET